MNDVPENRSLATLVSDLAQQVTTLLQTEGRLLRTELSENARKAGAGAIEVLGGAICLMAALMVLLQALVIGFILFNLLAVTAIVGVAYVGFDWVAGLLWYLGKTYAFVFLFVWMRATLPRVRVDQLMGFAWKWLLPASLLNLFFTAAAILVVDGL